MRRKYMRFLRFGVAALLAAALLGDGALAQRQKRAHGERAAQGAAAAGPFGRHARIARAIRSLELSAAQVRAIEAIRDRHDARVREQGRRILEGRRRVEEALAGDASPERPRALARELSEAVGEATAARTLVELEVFRSLTPEQRAELRRRRDAAKTEREQLRGEPGMRRRGRRQQRLQAPPRGGEPPPGGAQEPGEPRLPGAMRDGAFRGRGRRGVPELAPEQREQLRRLWRERGSAVRELAVRIAETQRATDDALLADAIDAPLVERLAADLGRLSAEREMARFEVEAALRSILTPEQAAALRESRRRRFGP